MFIASIIVGVCLAILIQYLKKPVRQRFPQLSRLMFELVSFGGVLLIALVLGLILKLLR